jgi:hypothetical protein
MKPGNDLGRAGLFLTAWYKIDSFISSASYSASFPIVTSRCAPVSRAPDSGGRLAHSAVAAASRWSAARASWIIGWKMESACCRGARKTAYASRARSISPSCW